MKGKTLSQSIRILALVAALLLTAGAVSATQSPNLVQAAPEPLPPVQQPDNSLCLSCHSNPEAEMELSNGDKLSIYIDMEAYSSGVHANHACQTCHPNIASYPHPTLKAQSAREYKKQYEVNCTQCHPNEAKATMDNAHAKLAAEGNPNTPSCADCHSPHATAPIAKDANGDPAPSENANIALICSNCHSTIVEQYRYSVHGEAVFEESNPDVPACDECHGIHNLKQARTIEFRLNSPNMCAECHTRADIMDKYGISTQVMDTYVADFHGTTVTLFEKQSPDQDTNKAVCYDCHGVHAIAATDDPIRGLQVKTNILQACQRCHPDATQNFPDTWLSHYIPNKDKYPVVYYVDLFYKILIPGALGFMALIIATDVYRRITDKVVRKPKTDTPPAPASEEKKEG